MPFKNDDARVPFAVIGILLIIMSTVASAFLIRSSSAGIDKALTDESEADLNDALMLALSDIERALNYSGMYAEAQVGARPVGEGDTDRIKRIAYGRLEEYVSSCYGDDSFVYGDYIVNAWLTGGYRSISIETMNMSVRRVLDSPVIPCGREYDTYYVMSVPVRLNIKRQGTAMNDLTDCTARTVITSRYPLLKEMTCEYEERLNGTPMLVDVTGASMAYTFARGYAQYAYTEPMNIVDNSHLELIANGAVLLEQGFVFNSVDPVSLASLTIKVAGGNRSVNDSINKDRYGHVNPYNATENSYKIVNGTPPESISHDFSPRSIVNRALIDSIKGPGIKNTIDSAYTCEMHVRVSRKVSGTGNISVKELVSCEKYPGTVLPVLGRETWHLSADGVAEVVILEYVVDRHSLYGNGDDVTAPFDACKFSGYDDHNMARAVESYRSALSSEIDLVLKDRNTYPDGSEALKRTIVSKRDPWVECEAKDTLYEISSGISEGLSISVRAEDYGSPQDMVTAACAEMEKRFCSNYTGYLDEGRYMDNGTFRSCGAKGIYHIKRSFLDSIGKSLNASSMQASASIDESIDSEMSKHTSGVNSSGLSKSASASKSLLSNNLYIPFGLPLNVSSPDKNYSWSEKAVLAVDQKPDYLDTEMYVDPMSGYRTYPLKVRNICLFSLPADLASGEETGRMVLRGIEAISDTSEDMPDSAANGLPERLSVSIKEKMKQEIRSALLADTELGGSVSDRDIENTVERAFEGHTGDDILRMLKAGEITQEISGKLSSIARAEAVKKVDSYQDMYANYIASKVEAVTADACERAIEGSISDHEEEITAMFKDFVAVADRYVEKESVKTALKAVPMGVPLLPPYGYWATLNVWYIEVDGEIPVFTVYDADCEPIPDPVFGHHAISHTRQRDLSIDDGYGIVGDNEPLKFHTETCTFIIVPPGKSGVGDRIGGWDEKSPGYNRSV